MKDKLEVENEIKRLKAQVRKIKKNSKEESLFKKFGGVIRIITLESNIHALEWIIDEEDETKLGFNLKDK